MSNAFKDWTPEMVAAHNARIVGKTHEARNPVHPQSKPAQPERPLRHGPLPALEVQEGFSARLFAIAQTLWSAIGTGFGVHRSDQEGEAKRRYFILITDIRDRLIDEDNLCEKYVVDCLRYCGKIPQDDPATCKILTTQRKATHPDEVGIRIDIIEL